MRLRTAQPADLPAVLELWAGAGAAPTHTDNLKDLTRLLEISPGALVLAEDDAGVLIGSVIAGWDGWRGSIYRLVVAPDRRRHGLGRRLLRHAEQSLRARGATRLQAVVVEDDSRALGFWRASGWDEQAHRTRFVEG